MKEILEKYFLIEIVEDSEPDILGWKIVGNLNSECISLHVRTTIDGWLDIFDIKFLQTGLVVANYPDSFDFYIEELKDVISELYNKVLNKDLFSNSKAVEGITITDNDVNWNWKDAASTYPYFYYDGTANTVTCRTNTNNYIIPTTSISC